MRAAVIDNLEPSLRMVEGLAAFRIRIGEHCSAAIEGNAFMLVVV